MESIFLIVILIEYVLFVTTAAPMFLVSRFNKAPTLGIWIWVGLFVSVIIAGFWSLALATWSVFETYIRLQANESLWFTLIASITPWAMLGFAGVLMALANQRLAPLFSQARSADYLSLIAPREVFRFEKARVFELDLPSYFAVTKKQGIYLSSAGFDLPEKQLQAVLRHEYGHIKLAHNNLKKISAFAVQLMPWLAVSRAFNNELARLCELSADRFALKKVDSADLQAARKLFV